MRVRHVIGPAVLTLSLSSLSLVVGACTLINESRLGDPAEACQVELAECVLPGELLGECRGGVCVPLEDLCTGDDCEEPRGPGQTSFSSVPGETSGPTTEFRFSSTVATAEFECRLDGGPFTPCASPWMLSELSDGGHTFEVRAVGLDGTRESPALAYQWTVDSTVLDTFFVLSPPATTGKTATFEFDGTLAEGFECRLSPSEAEFAPCESPKEYVGLPQRAAPGYLFEVRAVGADAVPDATPANHAFMVDAVGPTVTIGGTPTPNGTTNRWDVNFTFTASEPGSTFRCAYNQGVSFNNCNSAYGRVGNRPGAHTLYVKAIDAYGNEGPVVTRTWNVVPMDVTNIRTVRTQPIADGTIIRLNEGWAGTATRITFIDHDYEERYWIQQSDGDTSPDNAGMMVYPYSSMPSVIGSSPRITGVVWRSSSGETMLVDAEHGPHSNTFFANGRWIDNDADEARLEVNQGLLVRVGGRYFAGSGGCSGATVHLETCNGTNRVLCLDLSFVSLPPPPGSQSEAYLSFEGIPIWTDTGVRLLVVDYLEVGDDVCL